MHSLFISNRTRIVLKEITFVLLLHAVDRDEFRKGGTFPYDDDTDVSQEQNKCCSMRWIDLFTELVLRQILKIDSADHLFLRKKKKQARGTHQKSRLVACHLPVFYYSLVQSDDFFVSGGSTSLSIHTRVSAISCFQLTFLPIACTCL